MINERKCRIWRQTLAETVFFAMHNPASALVREVNERRLPRSGAPSSIRLDTCADGGRVGVREKPGLQIVSAIFRRKS
jgi:hypothetical protein